MKYFLLLGQNTALSLRELSTLLPTVEITQPLPDVATVELASDESAEELMKQAGGLVKITKFIQNLNSHSEIIPQLTTIFTQYPRLHFAIAELGRDHLPKIEAHDIKQQLKQQGITSRYVEGSRHGLSAAVLLHQAQLREFVLIQTAEELSLTQTVAIQDIDDWSFRDRAKPYSDRKKGMLPPKLARIMVNMATGTQQNQLVYDPFCGTGTILLEALMRHHQAVGSDLDETAVTGCRQNLAWFTDQYPKFQTAAMQAKVFVKDVSQVQVLDLPAQVDAIVTEPYLGKPSPQVKFLPDMFKGLEKMYLGAFKQWTKILKPGAPIVIVFPMVETAKHTYSLESLIDKLAGLGYTTSLEPVVYSRPDAIVQRQIFTFHYQA